MGWRGSARHWQRFDVAYLLLAGIATPLVVSVHTVVGFDFATSIVPGWHNTIFPPYFVAGAIYSGFAMVLTLAIPLRAAYGLQDFITERHLENMAKVMLATGLMVAYGYVMEAFFGWYSANYVRRVRGDQPRVRSLEIERRNQAVVAFLAVTAGRVNAVASFRLGHFDIEGRVILQDARVVRTKNRKTFETWLFPVDDDLEEIVIAWARYLLNEKGWTADDPLFPSTRVALQPSGGFGGSEIDRKPWTSTGPIRKIVSEAFHRAGLPYPNPHAFRETIVAYGRENCVGWAAMQAWAQNLGHESLTTTFGSYGKVSPEEQGRLVRSVRRTAQVHHALGTARTAARR